MLLEPLSVRRSARPVGAVNLFGQARHAAGRAVPSDAVSAGEVRETVRRVTAALPGGGEERQGQHEMAAAVAHAISEKRHVVVQAGTGTGKSWAYLVPAILSGKKTIVATATKALQDQLANKDLPFLATHLGRQFSFSVLKGRGNYLCLQKTAELGDDSGKLELETIADDEERLAEVTRIVKWAGETDTGDRADLDFEPSARAWSALSVTANECPGAIKCPMGDECFAEAARQRAEDADVVVVNTYLYGVHLASGGHVLPEHEVVVIDEAHQLEDVAAHTLGLELGGGRFVALARALRGILADAADAAPIEEAGRRLEAAIEPHRGRRLDPASLSAISTTLAVGAERISRAIGVLRGVKPPPGPAAAKKERAMKAATSLAEDIAAGATPGEDDVAWVEGPPHAPVLRVAPVDVGPLLAEKLWRHHTAVLTSATIPIGLPDRVGLAPATYDQLDVGSPFDFEEHALLYCAAHLPDPRHPDYEPAVIEELAALLRAAGGRTLALFTSWRMMRLAAEKLAPELPYRVLTQDELPKPALVRAFAGDESSCLFATMGFWQGVDVPGRALSMVVIDKLPFARPDEPLAQARRERAGPAAFRAVDLPRAATMLAQGAGRLIRSATDRGVVAVLDSRLATAGYRWDLVRALPPMRRTADRDEVEAFLAQ